MRITGGIARGRSLGGPVPPGVRPTTDRVREALFSILGQDLEGTTFLDAFGGAGLVAIDAWSRGADVTTVERDGRAFDALCRRVAGAGARVRALRGDVLLLAPKLGLFEVVFADPPYAAPIAPILEALAPLTARTLVAEVQTGSDTPDRVGRFIKDRVRQYGATELVLYVIPAADEPDPSPGT